MAFIMSGNSYFNSNIVSFKQNSACLNRPRIRNLLENAICYPLVVICAGAGYGKTRAVHSFLQEYSSHAIWLQLSERDNNETRFWESYVNAVSLSFPETRANLLEIGFPDTDEAFAKYYTIMQYVVNDNPGKHIRVFDDLHLLHNPAVLRFFERVVNTAPPNVTLLLISRTMPEIDITGMILHELIFTIQEETLCFTESEIDQYFSQLNLSVTRSAIRNIYDDTQGWAFAVNLIGRSLQKDAKYERCALEAMKANIFKHIEAEISSMVSERLWRFLLYISLIDHLAASLIRVLADNDDALIKEMELINSYIRYDFHLDTYMIHHLFLDYLRQNQHILTDEEKQQIHQKAGEWCDANGYHMDALSYYEKSGDYNSIARKIGMLNVQMPPDMARYAIGLFDNAPEDAWTKNPLFPGMHIRVRLNIGQFDEDTIALARRYAEIYEAQPESPEKNCALTNIYANWAFLEMFKCTYTDEYNFDVYYKKMGECYGKNPFKTIGSFNLVPISAWASLVGTSRAEAQKEYLDAMSRSIPATSALGKGFFVGFDDLIRGELCFLRGEFNAAEQYLKQSADKAQLCDQYATLSRALAYMMRISFLRGDFAAATEKLTAMKASLNEKDYGARYTIYDIASGFYQLSLGRYEQIPEWLKGDFSPYAHPSFIENYANRIKAQYHYQKRHYSELLAFIGNQMEKQTVLFGRIDLKVLQALSLYQLKRHNEAVSALTEAYELAEPNGITVLFIQYSKDMRTLTAAALKDENCRIPKDWLENINRKASAFAKRQSHMISEYMAAHHIDDEIALTKRETNILRDLSQGLSRTEIAASQNISANTVKMVTNIIYDKLCVNSLPDAIRVAVSRKIV